MWHPSKFPRAGDFSSRVPSLDIPEFDNLGRSFNRMADDLEDVESRRRELVGDLTHELRTPLTIVKGYLEGLADGTIAPSDEIYGRLVRETERLQRACEIKQLEQGGSSERKAAVRQRFTNAASGRGLGWPAAAPAPAPAPASAPAPPQHQHQHQHYHQHQHHSMYQST